MPGKFQLDDSLNFFTYVGEPHFYLFLYTASATISRVEFSYTQKKSTFCPLEFYNTMFFPEFYKCNVYYGNILFTGLYGRLIRFYILM